MAATAPALKGSLNAWYTHAAPLPQVLHDTHIFSVIANASYPAWIDAAQLSVWKERKRQDAKWGEQNNDPLIWLAVLGEEVGEVSTAILNYLFKPQGEFDPIREELVHCAAVALAAIECIDRDRWGGETWRK